MTGIQERIDQGAKMVTVIGSMTTRSMVSAAYTSEGRSLYLGRLPLGQRLSPLVFL